MSGAPRKEVAASLIRFYSLVLLILVLDQISKWAVLSALSLHESIPIIEGVFHFTLVHNTGVAFGLLRDYEQILFFLITLSLIVLICWSHLARRTSVLTRLSLAFILGGAIGNWIDRIRFGAVIDFLDFRIWPVFNIADSAITLGVVFYLWAVFRTNKRREMQPGDPA